MDAKAGKQPVKASAAELDLILEVVIEMLIKGHTRTDIIRFFQTKSEDNPNFIKSERSIDYYIADARKSITKRFEKKKDFLIAMAISRYEDLYKKNYQIQDYRECRSIQDSMNKVTGVNAVEKSETIVKIEQPLFGKED